MKYNHVSSLMQFLNWAELNGCTHTAAFLRGELARAMAPVVTASPFPLAT